MVWLGLRKEIDMATTELERMVVRLTGDTAQYNRVIKGSGRVTQRFASEVTRQLAMVGTKFKALGSNMRRMGRTLSMRLTLPLTIFGGFAVRAFAKFDQAMIESTSIMKVTTEQTKRMREVAISLSGKSAKSATDLAESYFFLASAGKDAEQSMALLPKVTDFAIAGAFNMAVATDLLTDAQSALGLASKDVAQDTRNLVRVSDVLVKANTLANASVEQFSVALTSKAGASLKAFNKDVEEGVAVLAAFADQGVKSQLAGNQLDRVIRLLAKSSMDNAKEHKRLGFEVFDSAGKMRNMGDIVGNLEDILRGMSDQTKVATLDMLGFEARVQQAILPLLGTSDAIKRYEKELRKAGGTTKEVADKQMKSFANQMKILWNRVKIFAIGIGETLSPILLKLNDIIGRGLEHWNALSSTVKKSLVFFSVAAAVLGPLLIGLGTLASALSFIAIGLAVVIPLIGTALAGAFAFAINPVTLFVAAVAGIGALVLTQTRIGGEALAWFGGQWKNLVKFVEPAMKGIKDALQAGEIKLAAKILWLQLKLTWKKGIQPLKQAWFGLMFFLKKTMITGIAFVQKEFLKFSVSMTVAMLTVKAKLNLFSDGLRQINMQLFALEIRLIGIDAQAKKSLGKLVIGTLDSFANIQKEIEDLEKQRDKAIGLAAVKIFTINFKKQFAKMSSFAKKQFAGIFDFLTQDLPIPNIPEPDPITVPVSFTVSKGIKVGTAEAFALLSRIPVGLAKGIPKGIPKGPKLQPDNPLVKATGNIINAIATKSSQGISSGVKIGVGAAASFLFGKGDKANKQGEGIDVLKEIRDAILGQEAAEVAELANEGAAA